jgi:hypothetical protein
VATFDPELAAATPSEADQLALLKERLNDPATAAKLLDLLDHIDTLSGLLTVAQGLVARSEAILDNVTQSAKEMAGLIQVDPALSGAAQGAANLGRQALPLVEKVGQTDVVAQLADSPMTDDAALSAFMRVVDALGTTLTDVQARPPQRRRTLRGLPRQLRDPDFNRGFDFLLRFVQQVGAGLAEVRQRAPELPPASADSPVPPPPAPAGGASDGDGYDDYGAYDDHAYGDDGAADAWEDYAYDDGASADGDGVAPPEPAPADDPYDDDYDFEAHY